ncbi:MAG TPA: hypothetical protein VNA12_01990 [Mycobacteriales bacterium]|nr:hypothetical protein [Mycobacteriales bacterium]
MPCYRCARVQTDPGRGASPWKRGVVRDEQVLVCPDCQAQHDWMADLDTCAGCGSTRLVRSLGATRCQQCGHVADDTEPGGPTTPVPGPLAAQVSAALRKVFGSRDA